MNKIERIITELTELTKNNKIQWKHKFEDYVVREDFPSVEFAIFLYNKNLCFHNKAIPGSRLYTPQSFNALSSVLELCKAVVAQIGEKARGEPEERGILDICLSDIADFKSRS